MNYLVYVIGVTLTQGFIISDQRNNPTYVRRHLSFQTPLISNSTWKYTRKEVPVYSKDIRSPVTVMIFRYETSNRVSDWPTPGQFQTRDPEESPQFTLDGLVFECFTDRLSSNKHKKSSK